MYYNEKSLLIYLVGLMITLSFMGCWFLLELIDLSPILLNLFYFLMVFGVLPAIFGGVFYELYKIKKEEYNKIFPIIYGDDEK